MCYVIRATVPLRGRSFHRACPRKPLSRNCAPLNTETVWSFFIWWTPFYLLRLSWDFWCLQKHQSCSLDNGNKDKEKGRSYDVCKKSIDLDNRKQTRRQTDMSGLRLWGTEMKPSVPGAVGGCTWEGWLHHVLGVSVNTLCILVPRLPWIRTCFI